MKSHQHRPTSSRPAAGLTKRCVLWGSAAVLAAAPLLAQESPEAAEPQGRKAAAAARAEARAAEGVKLYERDLRTDFDRRSATLARADLDELDPGAPGWRSAIYSLGAAGAIESRRALVEATTEVLPTEERIAAIFGLGALGSKIGPAIDALQELCQSDEADVRTAAMVALIRTGTAAGRGYVADLAAGVDERSAEARDLLAYAADPRGQALPAAYRRLYLQRWDAAKAYGFVDGAVWASTLLNELRDDRAFLQALVLQLVLDLKLENAKDHLLEALIDGEGVPRVRVCTQRMPVVIEAMIDAGVWRPADQKEWKWLMLTILEKELAYLFPRTLRLAASHPEPVVQAGAVALLQKAEGQFGDLVESSISNEKAGVRALAASALGAAGNPDYGPRLIDVTNDPDPWVRANAIASLIRMGNAAGTIRAGRILAIPPEDREPLMTSWLFEALERAAPDTDIIEFLQDAAPRLEEADRAAVDSILLLYSRAPVDTKVIRRELPGMNPRSPEAIIGARALAARPGARDLRVLARLFPREGAAEINLELASGLARSGHRSVEPLLQRAVWELPWNLSVLAAGVVRATYGQRTLISWAANPPVEATEQDVRRLGYAIGEWGGLPAVEALRKRLNSTAGADLPALQGAILGALATRTR